MQYRTRVGIRYRERGHRTTETSGAVKGEPVGAHSGPRRRPRGGGAAAWLCLKGPIGGRGRPGPPM